MMHELQRKGSMSRGSSIDKQVRNNLRTCSYDTMHNSFLTNTCACLLALNNDYYYRWRK